MATLSSNLGFPRVGPHRELKTALEQFWQGTISEAELLQTAQSLQEQNWKWQHAAGIDLVPVGDFSLYDHVLDTVELVGAIPERYRTVAWASALERYFAMARGTAAHGGIPAMEMTKWFNTNYHYMVPEWTVAPQFQLHAEHLLQQIDRARQAGVEPRPVILGPVTLLLLGKAKSANCSLDEVFQALLPVYVELFRVLEQKQVRQVQLDEPCLVLELTAEQRGWLQQACAALSAAAPHVPIVLTSYFEGLRENLSFALSLPVEVVHLDLVTDPQQLATVLEQLPAEKSLSLGLVNGRNVWKTDLTAALQLAQQAVSKIGADRVLIAPSCSLLHSPIDLDLEQKLDPEVKSWMAFAKQKLQEIVVLSRAVNQGPTAVHAELTANQAAWFTRRCSQRVQAPEVRQRLAAVTPEMSHRHSPFSVRVQEQRRHLNVPLLPTTTIGSFPQTADVRKARADVRKEKITAAQYEQFLKAKTVECIRWQEEIGLDVLVHGEFERNDMVEYFGEQLAGFVVTEFGWVQSYGSRCVKPPVIYGDVSRTAPMTIDWITFAQQHTTRPMKGMLTGPVTILFWSFVRDDQPRSETCRQIALAIRDEVSDLEAAGIKVIQIDEPAIREGLPLKHRDWHEYLNWAVDCFRLSAASVADQTQIHTHMCYSEFNDILEAIARLDADVISIETSRSQMELLDAFAEFDYPNAIGPGVYDIHSPRVPTQAEVLGLLQKAKSVLPVERLWVNPDCGLKTRGWEEVRSALKIMVAAARELRTDSASA